MHLLSRVITFIRVASFCIHSVRLFLFIRQVMRVCVANKHYSVRNYAGN